MTLASVHRTARSLPGFISRTSSSFSITCPVTLVLSGSNRMMAAAIVDLPQPDSPASPRTSPLSMSKLTPRTAGTSPDWIR